MPKNGIKRVPKIGLVVLTLNRYKYSQPLNIKYIERIYEMSSWQFFNGFYTILRKSSVFAKINK